MKPTVKRYATEIASVFSASPEVVSYVINKSRERRILYHGIKSRSYIPKIMSNGIEPRTPECSYSVCMTTGLRLFMTPDQTPFTYDTSFFHHSHNESGMSLAVTDYQSLRNSNVDVVWNEDSDINIKQKIPPGSFSLIVVDNRSNQKTRESGIKLELKMLELLYSHIKNYSVGKFIVDRI